MRRIIVLGCIIFFIGLFLMFNFCDYAYEQRDIMYKKAQNVYDVATLFAMTPEEIETRAHDWIASAKNEIDTIIAIPHKDRTYNNTMQKFDILVTLSDAAIGLNILQVLELTSPIEDVRDTAHKVSLKIQNFFVESIAGNKKLYEAIQLYAESNALQETLSEEQKYFITETIADFKRSGLNLPDEQLETIKKLDKEIQKQASVFEKNIASDNRTITVLRDGLSGLQDEFIAQLEKNDVDEYILGVDYPTYFYVMQNCTNVHTRKSLWMAFSNRAYPQNESVLQHLLALRDKKAKLLGFASYAAYDVSNQMVQTVEKADQFLHDLITKSAKKVSQEFALITKDLPESVVLTDEGKLYPWDFAFVSNYYKKTYLAIDEQEIKEYFPMEHTITQLLAIYSQFLSVSFEEITDVNVWHEDVKTLQVYNKDKTALLGTLFLDLYPRDNKYSHACHATVIPTVQFLDDTNVPDVSVVIANFPKPSKDTPSLLKRDDVSTFFHEFGHAMHAILGRTSIASFSGTSTKTDFVELPSQMLEEWLWDTEILQKVSSHYKTGESLPDTLIEKIKKSKTILTGHFVQRQSYLSLLCLAYYAAGEEKNMYQIMKDLYTTYRPHMYFDSSDHFYASYGHLPSYAAKYYGYLWSKVFALDVFAEIKKQGLLDSTVGKKYVTTILAKGGSKDPNQLLIDFLGREPNSNAFFTDMGI